MMLFLVHRRRHRVRCSRACPRASCPARTAASCLCSPRRRRTSPSRPWRRRSAQVPKIVRADPNVEAFMGFIGASGFNPSLNIGRATITLKPRRQAQAGRRGDAEAAAETAGRARASRCSCRTRRSSASAASSPRAPTSTPCRARVPRSCTDGRRCIEAQTEDPARTDRT